MLGNQFKIAFRNLWKNKSFSLINILGLSLGMACCFLIIQYCWHEFSYDRFHRDADRLYRIEYKLSSASDRKMARVPPPLGPALENFFPEIEAMSRFYPRELSLEVPSSRTQFEMEDVFFVDSTVFEVFEFDFIQGNPGTALLRPESVILTDVTARKLFGSEEVVGQTLRLAGVDGSRVSAVVRAWPDHAHLEFSMLLPYKAMIRVEPAHAQENTRAVLEGNWIATHSYTYVKLKPGQDPEQVNARFKAFIQEKGDERFRNQQSFSLIPVPNIHLYSDEGGPKPSGNVNYLYLFLFVGLLTLLIACINFINLSTASSMTRAREVGVRKVLGARRQALIGQFLVESLVLSFLAFLIAITLSSLALPYLNKLTGLSIDFNPQNAPLLFFGFVLTFIFSGVFAGLYPAFFVSRYEPVSVLKGSFNNQQKPWNEWLRKGLITFQFVAAIGFIAGALTLYLQINYLRNQPLGFHQELVVGLPLNSGNNINALFRPGDASLRQRMNTFDESLMNNPRIKSVTQCSHLPGTGAVGRNVWTDSIPQSANFFPMIMAVDYDFAETFDLRLLAGRDFDQAYGTDHLSSFLINEQAMNRMGWTDPEKAVGQKMVLEGKEGMIVGILQDFHFQNLRSEISPLVMEVRPGAFSYFALTIDNSNLPETLSDIERQWKTAFPEKVFEYTFLDDTLDELYLAERRLASIIGYFAFLAIFISCFGLFGLAALVTRQRFKEIGIRKVLGASLGQILRLISGDFMRLIAIAMIVAAPLTWYLMQNWLTEFAYRIDFPWWTILLSGFLVMLIAFLTISAQSVRAALSNPVEAIKNE